MKNFSRRALPLLLALLLSLAACLPALAQEEAKIQIQQESGNFMPQETGLFFYVMPLLGADSMLLVCDGQTMMVDMGKRKDYPLIKEQLDLLGIKRIDIAFNTHPHSDHIGGMEQLAQDLPVGRFITVFPKDFTGPSVLQNVTIRALERLKVPIERMKDGSSFELGGASIQVMKTSHNHVNGASAVLHITYKDTSLLLAADITRQAQDRLQMDYGAALKADVLKYPHHGQKPLQEDFTKAVSPVLALITHGSANSKEGQKWLDKHSIPFKFATWGLISLYSDGQTIKVCQQLSPETQAIKERWEKNRP